MRAGLVLLEQAATLLPACETYHLGYVRDDETLQARSYLNKLPAKFSEDDLVLITDPMLATGGTMMQVRAFLSPPLQLVRCKVAAVDGGHLADSCMRQLDVGSFGQVGIVAEL